MSNDREDREHTATGIRFVYAGQLERGNRELGATGAFDDIDAWRCSRCHALVVEGESDGAHAEQHARVDAIEAALVDLAEKLDRVASGALKPRTKADRVNDEHRERRIAAYREAIEQGRTIVATGMSIGALVDTIEAADAAPIGVDTAAWTDSASVREVPPT